MELKIVVLFACLAFANVVVSKPTSNEKVPCVNGKANVADSRAKREADKIIQEIGALITNILHETFCHADRNRQRNLPQTITNIGNGAYNTNYIALYNVRPYYK
ncbi:uncharacterized protein LOC124532439 [Vanessa cardui]|uniref:uncharacterized protein LOC124532439 n=1 Tax=Vanessa cardui TaxID=171605 RepID=UPI001F136CF8|nr:uncharacterized protein LOC124532439 [Vanessa cardui]